MKTLFFSILALAIGASAQAGSISLDFRADHNSTTYTDSSLSDFNKFYFKTGRIDFQGKATDDVSFRVRFAFNKDATTTNTVDGVQAATDYAYLSDKVSDWFTLTVGKFNTEVGGFEAAAASADQYLLSESYTKALLTDTGIAGLSAATGYGVNVIANKDVHYLTGVKATFTFNGQTVHIMATDKPASTVGAAGSTSTNQNSSLMGAAWKGLFLEKALSLNLSYHTMEGPSTNDKHQFMAAGFMWNSAPITFSTEYLTTEFKEDASSNKDSINSIVAKLAYTGIENWLPRLEFTSSEVKREIGGDITNRFMGYGAVLEYKPYPDTTFRYHIAYNNITEKPDTGSDIKKDEVVVGARLMADFLK